jgi:RNA polymerase sigma factor (sigma-70 family)
MEERDLVARATRADDISAFGALVRMHQSRVRAFLRRLTRGDSALADDLAQETFLEAQRKLRQYRGDGTFVGWLLRIAYSRFLMEVRRGRMNEQSLSEEESSSPEQSSAAKVDLEKAMAGLSAQERAALTLHFALGCAHEETASIMGVPLGTAKSHIARGRERLKQMLPGWESRNE